MYSLTVVVLDGRVTAILQQHHCHVNVAPVGGTVQAGVAEGVHTVHVGGARLPQL